MKKSVSIKDIAKLSHASITTVSFALNGKGRISEATKKRILEVAEQQGYHANRMAVGLRTGVSKIIGLVVDNMGGQFFGVIAKILEEEAEKFGYRILYCSTNNNLQKGRDAIKMLSQQLVDGYIITPLKGLEEDILQLTSDNKPVVLIDGYFPELPVPYVLVDNFNAVKDGIECFVHSGYQQIGFVTKDLDLIQLNERFRGYSEGITAQNLKFKKKNILNLSPKLSDEEAVLAIKEFIVNNKKLDAIFFSTNYLGALGLQSLKDLGLHIPEDIGVISFDDNELFNLYPPGITSIKQPTYEIAKTAIDLLFSQIRHNETAVATIGVQLPATLIERGSTRPKSVVI